MSEELDRFTRLACLPYDFDDLDAEVAKELTPEPPELKIASLLARAALRNKEWRANFERSERAFASPPRYGSMLATKPDAPLGSQEMREWIAEVKMSRTAPRPSFLLKLFRSLAGGLYPVLSVIMASGVWFLSGSTAPHTGLLSQLWMQIALLLAFFVVLPVLAERLFKESLPARLALLASAASLLVAGETPTWLKLTLTLVSFLPASALVLLEHQQAVKERNLPPSPCLLPGVWKDGATRYGSSVSDPHSASSLLRSQSDLLGVELRSASKVQLASASILADAWALLYGATHVDEAASFGPTSVLLVSRAMARASGYDPTIGTNEASPLHLPGLLEAAQEWDRWLESHLGSSKEEAKQNVLEDLASVQGLPSSLGLALEALSW